MRRFHIALALMILIVGMLTACSGGSGSKDQETDGGGLKYATMLTMTDRDDGITVARIRNPWDTTTLLDTYILVPDSLERIPAGLPEGTVIRTPIKGLTLFASVHASPIAELGAESVVNSVVDPAYFTSGFVARGIADGTIINCGNSAAPSPEKLLSSGTQALMLSMYKGMEVKGIDRLGIPLIRMVDNMEPTALGRAEWIRLIGALVGRRQQADSIFGRVERDYNTIVVKDASNAKNAPTVMVDKMYQGVWYVPAGEGSHAHMIADAGGRYIWRDTKGQDALPLSYEQVLDKARDADIWIMRIYGDDLSLDKLLKEDPRYSHFKATKRGGVYAVNTQKHNVFEETVFHPEILLREYKVLISGAPDDSLRYYRRVR